MPPPRKRTDTRIKVSATVEERTTIEARAHAAGLSVSAYLRVLGLNHEPTSVLDHEVVLALAKVNADQGRLGGLLKLWLSERPGDGAPSRDVRRVLREIEALQKQLEDVAERL